MNYYHIEPEVAGSLGDQTVIDTESWPPKVSRLEFQFDGWLGDELLEMFPCFICTTALAGALSAGKLSGVAFESVVISRSENFLELYPDTALPEFYWLQVIGRAETDDFGVAENNRLVVSHTALTILKNFNVNYAEISIFSSSS
ncbi:MULTISPECIES: hypothetical protein [Pseudomonas syringae group]|uniref:Uncharacterized protein n=2 Tax=Pseudomonas syringae group TaxID=136849 RepID=A0A2K4WKM7_9PSED|nr:MULTISPECIES: hypothetical protein [Pseudomonas syringae group]KWS66125.1 hypothetical protein AL055_21390 [Pseudomonas amygdali pv. morsprunorum]POC97270.1 hypothetical protein BKM26_02870 [Pseudomonas avellanae]POD11446.1 hypothetical protein BKM20_03255 [Pseudomonas avellanae]SOS36441.1 hypothetical protein CFBP6411_05084 [Pseudomonas syringae group genomosp. 3]SPF20612.1 hypothetical protein PSCFBP3800_05161 [Pseudomonas syringae group genomosp. 3]